MYIKIISMLYLNSTSPKIENSFSSHSSGYNFVAATTPVLPKLKVWRWWLSKLKKSCREYLTNSGWNHLMTLKVIWKKSMSIDFLNVKYSLLKHCRLSWWRFIERQCIWTEKTIWLLIQTWQKKKEKLLWTQEQSEMTLQGEHPCLQYIGIENI